MTKSMKQDNNFIEGRRSFLKGTAYSVAGATLAAGVFETVAATPATAEETKFTATPKTLQFYPPLEEWDSFKELDGEDWKRGGVGRNGIASETNPDGIKVNEFMLVPTICSNCEAQCGLTAWVEVGEYKKTKDPRSLRVKKYMGNPLHAGSRGRNCAKGYAAQSQMYDPDRIPFPLKRAPGSKRGEGKWIRTSWDTAMAEIGKKMHDTLKKGDEISKKSIMYHVGRPNENGFGHRIPHSLGCDGYDSHTNICSAGAREGTIQWANDDRNSPDWANAKLIFLQSSHAADAGHYFQQSAGFIADARRKGAKMVVMDPRLSNSAGMADLWLPIWPGTETALYLYMANRVLNETDEHGKSLINHDFVENWINWQQLMNDTDHLAFMQKEGLIKNLPADNSYESYIKFMQEFYAPYTKEFVVKECKLEGFAHKLDELFDMFIDAGDRVSTFLWRAGPIAHRGGWMITRAGFLPLALRGALAGNVGGTGMHHWHVVSVNGKGDAATVAGERPPRVDVWNEIAWPPEYPLSSFEMSMIMPHLLSDDAWRDKWKTKGLDKIPSKLEVWIPRMYNPVWINPDGFRWIETLKDENRIGLSFNLSPMWSETNWYCDYVLPVGLAGERHDQSSEPTKPAKIIAFKNPALRVALEKNGWKPKDPARATLEAHMASGLGEIWEEVEFWANIMVHHVDPDGSLGVREFWASKEDPTRAVTIPEWYQAAFDHVPNLRRVAKEKYPDSKFPNYEMMRDMGTWLEEDHIFRPQERPLEEKDGKYVAHGHEYAKEEVEIDELGTMKVDDHVFGGKKKIGVVVEGEAKEGWHTLTGKLEFYSKWFAEWKWPEYAIPFYPRSAEERKKYVQIVSQVHHDFIDKSKNEFALNTVFRLPYNIHTRSGNSKHLMEISQNHNPVWIATKDAERMNINRGDAIKVTISDTVSGLESGWFIAMAVPTEGCMPGTLQCSHHAGRWKLKNAVEIPGFKHKLGVLGLAAPLFDMTMDGKTGTMKPKEGIDASLMARKDTWQFKEYNKDLENIWWDGLSGAWQNAVAAAHPDPIAGNHAWHQKVRIEKAAPTDKIGDIWVNYDNNFKVYQAWRDELTRPLAKGDTLRRPVHIKRPAVPLTLKAYSVDITS